MAAGSFLQRVLPQILTKEISDIFIRRNFQNLADYFLNENQLLSFKHFEMEFTQAASNLKRPHGLLYIPQDILVSKITGKGTVTFNTGLFDQTNMDISVSGACKIRFYVGTYWKSPPTVSEKDEKISYKSGSDSAVQGGSPIGAIIPYGLDTLPDEEDGTGVWLWCDGELYNDADYPIFAKKNTNKRYGGNSTQFRTPFSNGRVPRGVDDGAGIDPDANARVALFPGGSKGDNIGSYQEDALQNITGRIGTIGINGTIDGAFAVTGNAGLIANEGSADRQVSFDASRVARTSTETRMKNFNVKYIIRVG